MPAILRINGVKSAKSELEAQLAYQIKLARLPAPDREYRFAPPRRWRFDFAFIELSLAVEVEGGTWIPGGGRHQRGTGFEDDCRKYNQAALLGWMVLRFTGKMVKSGEALETIEKALGR